MQLSFTLVIFSILYLYLRCLVVIVERYVFMYFILKMSCQTMVRILIMNKVNSIMYIRGFDSTSTDVMMLLVLPYFLS